MKKKQTKIKVKPATPEEVMAIATRASMKLQSASLGQLQAALCSMAETYVEALADCPNEDTRRGVAMAIICDTLDAHSGAASLESIPSIEDINPPTGATN